MTQTVKAEFDKTLEILLELKISDVMSKDIITISSDAKMSEVENILREKQISGLPVLDKDKLVGVISIEDLIHWLSSKTGDCAVSEMMTKNPKTMYSNQPLAHALKNFDQTGFGRFPIVDRENGKLLGIVTKGNIIQGTLKKLQSEYAEEEIRQYRASHIFDDITANFKELYLRYIIKGKDFDLAGQASTNLKKNLKRLGIKPEVVRKIAIASYEAEINVVLYADGGDMEVRVTPEEIALIIRDFGPGIEDIEKAMQSGYTTSEPWVKELGFGAGMGLPNIKKCSDIMDIESTPGEGTILKLTFYWLKNETE